MASSIEAMFLEECVRLGVRTGRDSGGRLTIKTDAGTAVISLDNLEREFERDGDMTRITAFVSKVVSAGAMPEWPEARAGLRYSAQPSDLEVPGIIVDEISPHMIRALACSHPDESSVSFVSGRCVRSWGVTEAVARQCAEANLALLLGSTPVVFSETAGHAIATFETTSVYKASLIFAPQLKSKVAYRLGWPAFAIAPCRDFLMMWGASATDYLIPRLGAIVRREYTASGYPITPEVLKIEHDGVVAIGAFDVE